MRINRAAIKSNARLLMRDHKPQVYLFGLLLFLLSLVIVALFEGACYALFGQAVFASSWTPSVAAALLFTGLCIVLGIVLYLFQLGYVSYSLNLSRQRPGSYGNLFDGYRRFGRALGVGFLTCLFTFLWTLLYIVIFIVGLVLVGVIIGLVAGGGVNTAGLNAGDVLSGNYDFNNVLGSMAIPAIIIGIAAYILLIFFIVRLVIRYSQAQFLLFDHPELSALDCIRESKHMMKGRKGEYFVLCLSFIGWWILILLPVLILEGIGMTIALSTGAVLVPTILILIGALGTAVLAIFIAPYIQITFANYYTAISDLYFANVNYIKSPFPGYAPGSAAPAFQPQPGQQYAPPQQSAAPQPGPWQQGPAPQHQHQQYQPPVNPFQPPAPPQPEPIDLGPLPAVPDLPEQPEAPVHEPEPELPKPETPKVDDWEIGKP